MTITLAKYLRLTFRSSSSRLRKSHSAISNIPAIWIISETDTIAAAMASSLNITMVHTPR
jgi:hypothetical protein